MRRTSASIGPSNILELLLRHYASTVFSSRFQPALQRRVVPENVCVRGYGGWFQLHSLKLAVKQSAIWYLESEARAVLVSCLGYSGDPVFPVNSVF